MVETVIWMKISINSARIVYDTIRVARPQVIIHVSVV